MGNYWLDKENLKTGWTLNINNLEEFVVNIDQEPAMFYEKLFYGYDIDGKILMIDGRRSFEPIKVTHIAYDHDDRFAEVVDFLMSRETTKLQITLKYYEEGSLVKRWNIQDAYLVEGEANLTNEEFDGPIEYMMKLMFSNAKIGQV